MFARRIILTFTLLLLTCSLSAIANADPRIADVVQKLKTIDSAYLAHCTYEAEQRHTMPTAKLWPDPVITAYQFTMEAKSNKKALITVVTSNPVPNADFILGLKIDKQLGGFIPHGSPRSVQADKNGNRHISLETGLVSRFDKQLSGTLFINSVFTVTPAKEVLISQHVNLLYLNDATSSQLVYPAQRLLWSTGRGFSRYLQEVTAYNALPDGLIELSARSIEPPDKGSWTIVIDPNSAWLVRQAKFTRPNDKKPIIEVTTFGIVTKGSFSMPAKSTWKDEYTGGFAADFVFKDGRFAFSDEVYRKAESMVRGEAPFIPHSLVFDGRVTPQDMFQADENGFRPKKIAPPRKVQ